MSNVEETIRVIRHGVFVGPCEFVVIVIDFSSGARKADGDTHVRQYSSLEKYRYSRIEDTGALKGLA